MNDKIFISSGGYNGSAFDFVTKAMKHGITNIELSSGNVTNISELISFCAKENITIQAHNYFPPEKSNYVINLAKKSIIKSPFFKDILDAQVNIAHRFKRQFLHFHSGYCVDLQHSDMGKSNLSSQKSIDRQQCIVNLSENIEQICRYLDSKGLKLLLENNVIDSSVYNNFGDNPFLCCDPEEINELTRICCNNFGLLLDLAHLKVSANTLGFDFLDAVKKLVKITSAVHISDNDGSRDTNLPFDEASDVLMALAEFEELNFITIEVYDDNMSLLQKQIELIRGARGR